MTAGALTLQMREYIAECVGILEGHIDACYEMAQNLVDVWHQHEKQRKLCESLKEELRAKVTAEDIAYSAVKLSDGATSEDYMMCLNQIREICKSKTQLEIRLSMAENICQLRKRALEDNQRMLNDMHHEIEKLVKDLQQLGSRKYMFTVDMVELFDDCTKCAIETSPLKVISSI